MARINLYVAQRLLTEFQPVLKFCSPLDAGIFELFYPVNVNSWIDHAETDPTKANWGPKSTPALMKGTCVLALPPWGSPAPTPLFVQPNVGAGSAYLRNPAPPPITYDNLPPGGIGSFQGYKPLEMEYWLNFGGWLDSTQHSGDRQYVVDRYASILYDMHLDWAIAGLPKLVPTPDMRTKPMPMIYGEVEWGGIYPRLDALRVNVIQQELAAASATLGRPARTVDIGEADGSNTRDFAPGPNGSTFSDLDDYIVLTYYLFYPLADPIDFVLWTNPYPITTYPPLIEPYQDYANLPGPNMHEGQWEAVSVFLKARPEKLSSGAFVDPDRFGRPSFQLNVDDFEASFDLDNSYVVFTRGWGMTPTDSGRSRSACARNYRTAHGPKAPVERIGYHPVAYVTLGSHQNLFKEAYDVVTLGKAPPGPPKTDAQKAATVLSVISFALSIIAAIASELGPIGAIVGAILALIAAILSFIASLLDPDPLSVAATAAHGTEVGKALTVVKILMWLVDHPDPVGGLMDVAWPVDGAFIICMSAGTNYGAPNTVVFSPPGVALPGYVNSQPDLAFVNQFMYPGSPPPPPVFAFAGRWGVPVSNSKTGPSSWGIADRRVDTYLRSLGYWNTVALVDAVENKSSCNDYDGASFGPYSDGFPQLT